MKCDECNVDVVRNDIHYECPECGLVCGDILENEVLLKDRHKDNNNLGSIIGKEKGSYKLRRLAVTSRMSSEERTMKKAKFYCNVAASEFSMCEASKLTVMEYYNMLKSKGVFTSKMEL